MVVRTVWIVLALQTALFGADRVIPGYGGQVREVFDRALAQYAGAKSYRDRLVIESDADVVDESGAPVSEAPHVCTLTWAQPNHIALDTPVYSVFCNGKTLWQQSKQTEQYITSAAPERVDLATLDLRALPAYNQVAHPIGAILGQPDVSVEDLLGKIAKFDGIQPEARDGQPGHRVRGAIEAELPDDETVNVPFEVWFDDKTGLVQEIRFDHTEQVKKLLAISAARVKVNKFIRSFRFDQTVLDGEKPPETDFVFKPGPFDEKVTQLRMLHPDEWQRKLIGRPAPAFDGKDLDDKPFQFSDLKGRVVLLDFWASYCGPCIMAMPGLQRLADKFAGKPVSIIGVNADPALNRKRVKTIVETNKIKYRQYPDADARVFAAYRVQPIPCVVLIGKKGLIQAIHTGFVPGEEQRLAGEIDRLLAGESLFKPR